MAENVVLVTGATGQQGGATVRHLLEGKRVRVRALTRDPAKPRASKLAAQGVELVRGDFDDAASLRAALAGVSAVFFVQTPFVKGGSDTEERQGKAALDAAKAAGTPHVVYSSVAGADEHTGIPHFESKGRIEEHFHALGLAGTILRPVAFMDNMPPEALRRRGFLGGLRAALGNEKKLQLVATDDIGWFAARALEEPAKFAGRTLGLAGDELTVPEMVATWERVTGLPSRPAPFPRFALHFLPREFATMLRWFGAKGFHVDIAALRKEHPDLLTLAGWLERRKAR